MTEPATTTTVSPSRLEIGLLAAARDDAKKARQIAHALGDYELRDDARGWIWERLRTTAAAGETPRRIAVEAPIGTESEPVQQRLLETVAEIWDAEASSTPETDCQTLRAYHRHDALVKNMDRAVKAITRGDIDGAEGILASAAAAPSGPEDQRPPWPTLDERALHGLAGEVVRTIGPHSEADPAAILVQYVIAVGSVIGRSAYYKVEGSRHYTNLFGVLVGETAKARKGTAWDRVLEIVGGLDEDWNRQGGLSTGEGLIHLVRDAVTKAKRDKDGELVEQTEDEGVRDKRLLVVEPEFTRTLRAQSRDGNILSQVLREAWDSGNLATATRSSPLRATDAHISIIGHAVRDELVSAMSNNDVVGGTANRIQFFVVRRSKRLPRGGSLPESEVRRLQELTHEAVAAARRLGRMQLDAAARDLWESVYDVLSEGRTGQVGRVTARAEAQAMRLSVIYAALDGSQVIREVHLRAALALWTFADISAQWIFGAQTGSTLADKIRVGLRFSELRALEKRDLDLQAPGLWIRRSAARTKVSTPKNRRARFHVIPRDLAEELRRFMLTTEGQLLFADPRGVDKLLTNKVLNSWYTKLAEEAGVRRITSHGARHTAGSSYAIMGAGQKVIASLLGHADTAATERYTHVGGGATAILIEARWARLRG